MPSLLTLHSDFDIEVHAGLLPTALIDKYTFWQGGHNIIGYEEVPLPAVTDVEDHLVPVKTEMPSTRLKITLSKSDDFDQHGFVTQLQVAMVHRIALVNSNEEMEVLDPNRPTLTLLNVTFGSTNVAAETSWYAAVQAGLSDVVWSKSDIKSAHSPASI